MMKTYEVDADRLYDEGQVNEAIANVAQALVEKLKDDNPIVVCVLNGGLVFYGKLLTQLSFPLEVDYLHATRYVKNEPGDERTSSGSIMPRLFRRCFL